MYRPPGVDVDVVPQAARPITSAFYVVSPTKFIILFVCTMGIYQLYWFYAHFRRSKIASRDDSWPLARTVFAIFFTHGLFRSINLQSNLKGVSSFKPDAHATTFVLLTIAGRVVDRIGQNFEEFSGLALLGILLGLATGLPLFAAQKAANQAAGDPEGTQNSRLTVGNWAWCGLGMLFWLLILAGMLLPAA